MRSIYASYRSPYLLIRPCADRSRFLLTMPVLPHGTVRRGRLGRTEMSGQRSSTLTLWGMCFFLPDPRAARSNRKTCLVIQCSKRSAHVRKGKMMKRSYSATILPGVANLHLASIGGGLHIHRPRLLRKTAPLVSLTLAQTGDVIPRKSQRRDQHGL